MRMVLSRTIGNMRITTSGKQLYLAGQKIHHVLPLIVDGSLYFCRVRASLPTKLQDRTKRSNCIVLHEMHEKDLTHVEIISYLQHSSDETEL